MKKNKTQPIDSLKKEESTSLKTSANEYFSFDKRNYLFLMIGLGLIILGYLLMMGPDANTNSDGKFDPNYWNQDIFSWRRIRLAPFLIILGFAVQVYAILLKPKAIN